jgi:DNA replication protein DnaC
MPRLIEKLRYSHEVSQSIQQLQTDVDWARQAFNIMLFGPSGVGKSHLANALADIPHPKVKKSVLIYIFIFHSITRFYCLK